MQIQEIVDLHHHPHGHTSGAAEMPPRNKSAPQILLGGARHNGANRQWSVEDSPPASADAADDNANLEVPSNSVRKYSLRLVNDARRQLQLLMCVCVL